MSDGLTPAPLWQDEVCKTAFNDCDYSLRWTLSEIYSGVRPTREIRIFADGIFDLFHYGHANMLRQAKTSLPCQVRLIAGVTATIECRRYKREPVNDNWQRTENVRNNRYVDEVIPDTPWLTTPEFCEQYKIDFIAHDDQPYLAGCGSDGDVYGWAKRAGMFLVTKRTPSISTTDIIERIIKNTPSKYSCQSRTTTYSDTFPYSSSTIVAEFSRERLNDIQ